MCAMYKYELFAILCAVNCTWKWSEYTDCDAECGGGTKTRYPIITQYPQYGGKPCPSHVNKNESESADCNTHSCPSELRGSVVCIAVYNHFICWNIGVLN